MKTDWSSMLQADLEKLSRVTVLSSSSTEKLIPGERRYVAILFLDLEGFTELAEKLDHEVVHQVSTGVMRALSRVVEAYGGYVDKYEGDRIMALFGAQRAGENDCVPAVGCALRMLQTVQEAGTILADRGIDLAARVGINYGSVTVAPDPSGHLTASGDAVNVASRLEEIADRNSILVSSKVFEECGDLFEWADLGSRAIRGRSGPVQVFRPEGPGKLQRERWERAERLSLSPLVDRKAELELLEGCWEKQSRGLKPGRRDSARHILVLVDGETGIGKSRLVDHFLERKRAEGEDFELLEGRAVPYTQPPFWLWTSLLRSRLGLSEKSGPEALETALDRLIDECGNEEQAGAVEKSRGYLGELLGAYPEGSCTPDLEESQRIDEIKVCVRNVLRMICDLGDRSVVVLDGLQWIDESSRDTLLFVLSNLDTERTVLFLCLFRPQPENFGSKLEELPEGYAEVLELSLGPLTDPPASCLLANLLRAEGESPAEVKAQTERLLLDRSQGNPYFLEEMVLELLENGGLRRSTSDWSLADQSGDLDLPSSLGNLMRSRMDMLPSDLRKSLQLASVLGTEFDGVLFDRVMNRLELNAAEPAQALDSLVARKFLVPRQTEDGRRYAFKSSLVHDAAYDTILLHNRRILHGCAADAMQELYPRARESFPGVVTEHLYRSGNVEEAIDWGLATLRQFARRLHFDEVMLWVKRLTGWIDQVLDEPKKSLRTLEVLWLKHRLLDLRSRNERLEVVVTEMERLAEKTGEVIWKAKAKHAKGALLTHLGDNGAALQAERKALALAREASDRDTQAIVLSRMGSLLILTGKISEAEECFKESLSISRSADDVAGIATQYANLGNVAVERGELEEAEKLLNEALAMHKRSENRRGESIVLTGLGVVNGMR
ncbi:tetratricopeptide repeat protein, partial [Candidatus Fermentibacteria bacterium]|nr:tetratricopeptide repeat protein [Candidatus Fermentibacteria bacterium]